MNDIDKLLGKYFSGVSTTEEEKELKKYFAGNEILPEHEIYRPIFSVFNREKQIKAPILTFTEKRKKKSVSTRHIIVLLAGSAAIALLAVIFPTLSRTPPQHPEYVVIMNGKQIDDQHTAQQYAEYMFSKTEKIVENSYQPLQEVADIKEELNAEKILKETDQKIEFIKTNYQY